MKVTYKAKGFEISQECGGYPEAFGFVGDCEQAFGMTKCGNCQSENISPIHRKAKGYDFYEWKCGECHHSLRFGLTIEDHVLFPKRKSDNGEWLPNGGWAKNEYQIGGPQNGQQTQQKPAARTAAPPAPF
jgi:hypothetical protein